MGSGTKIAKKSLVSFLNGYKRANELIFEERKKRLAKLTPEQSLREYIELCELADELSEKIESEEILQKRLEVLIKRRMLFNNRIE